MIKDRQINTVATANTVTTKQANTNLSHNPQTKRVILAFLMLIATMGSLLSAKTITKTFTDYKMTYETLSESTCQLTDFEYVRRVENL